MKSNAVISQNMMKLGERMFVRSFGSKKLSMNNEKKINDDSVKTTPPFESQHALKMKSNGIKKLQKVYSLEYLTFSKPSKNPFTTGSSTLMK